MKKLKIPVTPHITKHLADSKVKHGKLVKVDYDSYLHFQERIEREYPHLSVNERDALIVTCCLTHPDHKEKHKPREWQWTLWLAILALLALFAALSSIKAHAQESGLDRITFQNSSGTVLRSFASPFVFKCSTNMTCSVTGNTVTVTAAGGGAGGGYSTIQNGGVAIAQEGAINFLGALACADNPGNTSSDCKLSTNAAVTHQFVTGIDSSGNFTRAAILAADVPTLNQSTTGNAATATALASNPTDCSANQYATAIDTGANLTCAQVAYGQVSGTPQLAVTKTCTGTDKVSAYDSTTGLFTCTTDQTGAGGSTPTGTGFTHITAGVQDSAAKTVDVSSSDITGVLAASSEPAHTGDVTNTAGSLALTIGAGKVTRADLAADAVGWQFLGTTSLGSTSATIAVTPSTTRKHYMVRLVIVGYGGTGVARAQFGNTSTIDTGTNYGFNGMNMAPATTAALTAVGSVTTGQNGVPVSGSTTTAGRFVQLNISNPGAAIKYFTIETSGAGSGASAPNLAHIAGVWNNTTSGIGGFQFTACTTTTSTCTTTTFLSGTTLTVWGRDDN